MAGIRIDDLPTTVLPSLDHVIPAMKDGASVKLTAGQVVGMTALATHTADDKTTPVDADELGIVDSAASWGLKKLTWASIKAALSSVFLSKTGGTMTGLLTLAPADDDPDGTASLNIPAGADVPDVQADGDLWADSNDDLRYRRGGVDARLYDSVNLPRPEPGEMAAGTETAPRALSAADVRAGVALSKMYESAEQTITNGGLIALAHGLGAKPKIIQVSLVCKVAEYGYSVGDEFEIDRYNSDSTNGYGVTAKADNTNVYVRMGSFTIAVTQNWTTGAQTGTLTYANWRLIVRAWA